MDLQLSNLLDSGIIKVKENIKTKKKNKKKKNSSLKKYKNIKNKKSVTKYKSPRINIKKIDDNELDKDLKAPNKMIYKATNESKKIKSDNIKEKTKRKKINLTKKKERIKKSQLDMISELKKRGIYVSGKNPKLLKDIYMYSLDDNIRIITQ